MVRRRKFLARWIRTLYDQAARERLLVSNEGSFFYTAIAIGFMAFWRVLADRAVTPVRQATARLVGRSWRAGLQLVFPTVCNCCGIEQPGVAAPSLCGVCETAFLTDLGVRCPRCGDRASSVKASGPRCASCSRHHYRFTRVAFLGIYEKALRAAVLRLKHAAEEPLAMALAELSVRQLGAGIRATNPDVVAPIPMHWRRRLSRDVNNPDLLAETWARRLKVPLARHLLVRRRNTPPQADLSPTERFANMRDAFRLGWGHRLQNAHVLLLDDILTTGATCHEAARLLLSAGAKEVSIVVLARAGDW